MPGKLAQIKSFFVSFPGLPVFRGSLSLVSDRQSRLPQKRKTIMKHILVFAIAALGLATGLARADQVGPQNRALIIVDEIDTGVIPELKPLYTSLENLTIQLPHMPILINAYHEIHTLRDGDATLTRFRQVARQLAMRSDIHAIDVFMVLHGSPGALSWKDGIVHMDDMLAYMTEVHNVAEQVIVSHMKKKFRLLYNTACFGATHRADFLRMGFDATDGAIGVNANSEVEYPSFLPLWTSGLVSFAEALAPTNNDAALAAADGPLVATGMLMNNFLKKVNSRKLLSGETNVHITTPAL